MSVELRLPSITGTTEKEMLSQIRSYLYQFVPQLQWALNTIESASTSDKTPTTQVIAQKTTSTLDAEASFNAIKSLIIKSADIVNAYYDEITERLEGIYVAESDFGTYTEETEREITKTAKRTEELFSNIQTIVSDIDNIEANLIETQGHITTGILDYENDGTPIIGVEVGQKDVVDGDEVYNRYARFTSGRLSFYDQNDIEVAWISGYKLYITNAEITGSLTLGGYIIDTSRGFTLKWVGKG